MRLRACTAICHCATHETQSRPSPLATAEIISTAAGRLAHSAERPSHSKTLISQYRPAMRPAGLPAEVRSSESRRFNGASGVPVAGPAPSSGVSRPLELQRVPLCRVLAVGPLASAASCKLGIALVRTSTARRPASLHCLRCPFARSSFVSYAPFWWVARPNPTAIVRTSCSRSGMTCRIPMSRQPAPAWSRLPPLTALPWRGSCFATLMHQHRVAVRRVRRS